MNQNLKRKRRLSDGDQEADDYSTSRYEKKAKMEEETESKFEGHSSERSYFAQEEDISSQLFHSDIIEQEVVTSECECETCTQCSSDAADTPRACSRQPDAAGHVEESEIDLESRKICFSPNHLTGYSSCDEGVLGSELISSPIAESIVDSDLDNETELHEIVEYDDLDECEDTLKATDDDDASICKRSGKAVSFMGQLTPSSSVGKGRPGTLACRTWTNFRNFSMKSELHASELTCPVPQLSWASREKFWGVMCRKDEVSLKDRNPDLFDYQQYLKPRMRIILLDWISEVATVFHLHRETYYLTIDYIDRYLSCVPNIPKQQLQLIGVTCLVLASKMEEIYPPKIDQFANVTDGACTEEEIFSMEVTILRHLNWLLSPITVNNWLEMMLQFIYQKCEKENDNLFTPHFSSSLFKKLCQLLDLVTLDITSLRFSYCVLAAAAIYVLVDPDLAISISGLKKETLEPCVQWMSVYCKVLRQSNSFEMDDVSDLLKDKSEVYFFNQHPELQTHNISMQLYELVQAEFESMKNQKHLTDDSAQMLTPPASSSKSPRTSASDENFMCY